MAKNAIFILFAHQTAARLFCCSVDVVRHFFRSVLFSRVSFFSCVSCSFFRSFRFSLGTRSQCSGRLLGCLHLVNSNNNNKCAKTEESVACRAHAGDAKLFTQTHSCASVNSFCCIGQVFSPFLFRRCALRSPSIGFQKLFCMQNASFLDMVIACMFCVSSEMCAICLAACRIQRSASFFSPRISTKNCGRFWNVWLLETCSLVKAKKKKKTVVRWYSTRCCTNPLTNNMC